MAPPSRDVADVLRALERAASKTYRADMSKRYGIVTKAIVYGTPVAKLKPMAKAIGVDHALAEALWKTGVHDARMLATMIGDPAKASPALMTRWAKAFDNWGIVDAACFTLFDRAPEAGKQIEAWAGAKDEFVKRAAFALIASRALHRRGDETEMARALVLIAREAGDGRNFVKKGVSWALRAIALKGPPKAAAAARALAANLATSDDATRRWVGKDAVKTLK